MGNKNWDWEYHEYHLAITQMGGHTQPPSLSLVVENIELLPFLLPGFKKVIDFIHVDFHHGNLNLPVLEAAIPSPIGKTYISKSYSLIDGSIYPCLQGSSSSSHC